MGILGKFKKLKLIIFSVIVLLFLSGIFMFNFNKITGMILYRNNINELYGNAKENFWMADYLESEKLFNKYIYVNSSKIEPYVFLFWQYYFSNQKNLENAEKILIKCINKNNNEICIDLLNLFYITNDQFI